MRLNKILTTISITLSLSSMVYLIFIDEKDIKIRSNVTLIFVFLIIISVICCIYYDLKK